MSLEFLVASIFFILFIAILPLAVIFIGFIFFLLLVGYFFLEGYYVLTHKVEVETIAIILLSVAIVSTASISIGYLTRDIPFLNRIGRSGENLDIKIRHLTNLRKLIAYIKIAYGKHLLRGMIVFLALSIAIIKIQDNIIIQ